MAPARVFVLDRCKGEDSEAFRENLSSSGWIDVIDVISSYAKTAVFGQKSLSRAQFRSIAPSVHNPFPFLSGQHGRAGAQRRNRAKTRRDASPAHLLTCKPMPLAFRRRRNSAAVATEKNNPPQ